MLGNGVHLHLPCTADELGDDHWMLLQQGWHRGYFVSQSEIKKKRKKKRHEHSEFTYSIEMQLAPTSKKFGVKKKKKEDRLFPDMIPG